MEDEPELKEWLEFYLTAYFDLQTTRQSGFGLTSFSYFSIRDYARDFEMGYEDYVEFEYFIREMEKVEFKIAERNK